MFYDGGGGGGGGVGGWILVLKYYSEPNLFFYILQYKQRIQFMNIAKNFQLLRLEYA